MFRRVLSLILSLCILLTSMPALSVYALAEGEEEAVVEIAAAETAEEPVVVDVIEEPKAEEPAAEEAPEVTEEPKVEEPAAEEAPEVTEEPKAEEPAAGEEAPAETEEVKDIEHLGEDESFEKGYVCLIEDAKVYDEAEADEYALKAEKNSVAYALSRPNAGKETDRLKVVLSIDGKAFEGYVNCEKLLPLDEEAVTALKEELHDQDVVCVNDDEDRPLPAAEYALNEEEAIVVFPVLPEEPTEEEAEEPEQTETEKPDGSVSFGGLISAIPEEEDEADEQEEAVTAEVANILAGIDGNSTDYQKIKTIYDWVCSNVTYDNANLSNPDYLLKFWNSVVLVVPIVVFQLIVAVFAAYGFTKTKGKLSAIVFFAYIILMMMPYQVTLVPNYLVLILMS